MQKKLNEDFIEEYSEQFAAKISDDFFAGKAFINGQEILNISPSKQVNFFVIKLLFNNWQLESQRLESPFFDYTAPDVKDAMVQFMNVLSRHIKIGRKEFEPLLQDAVRDTLFLVMAPNVFMEIEMDRRGTEELTEKTAKNILKYLRVSKESFSDYLLANVGIDRDEIRLDEDIISEEVLLEEISYLNEVVPVTLQLLEEGDENEEAEQDSMAMLDEPEDEEAALLKVEPEDLFKSPPVHISIPDVAPEEMAEVHSHEEIRPIQEPITEEEVAEEEIEEEIAEEEKPEEPNSAPVPTLPEPSLIWEMPVHDVEEEEEREEEEVEEEEPEEEPSEQEPAIITNVAPEDEDDEEDEDNILNAKFEDPLIATSIAEAHENQVDSMMSAISLNQRFMFINELFDGDPEVFKQAIDKVDACQSFDESVELLVQLYAKEYHWDMNSEEVKELLKIIFRRFR